MKQPTTHEKAHPMWPHRWNPYTQRDYVMWLFDKGITNRLLSFDGWVDGEYSTALTPDGYAVESEAHPGSVQIYPASALENIDE